MRLKIVPCEIQQIKGIYQVVWFLDRVEWDEFHQCYSSKNISSHNSKELALRAKERYLCKWSKSA
jgi:hypothetical protein